jgi:hypothetical protein
MPNYAIKPTSVGILFQSFASGASAPYFGCWAPNMKIPALIIMSLLAGCASNPVALNCTIYELGDSLEKPLGLIELDDEFRRKLRNQLPTGAKGSHVCWYTSGSEIVAANPGSSGHGASGYSFSKKNGLWVLEDETPFIIKLGKNSFLK